MIRDLMEEIDEVGGEMRNLTRLAREYSPNEPLVPISFQRTVGFGRSYDSIMEDVNNYRILMESLRTMNDETRRRMVVEQHPNIVCTGIIIFMHLGDLFSLYQMKIDIDAYTEQELFHASSRAETEAMARVRTEEARVELEITAAGNDIRMIAEIRTRASINAESVAVTDAAFQRDINTAVDIARKALIANQDAVHAAINVVSRASQINASSIRMSQAALQRAISSVLSATRTLKEMKVIAVIAEAGANVSKKAFEIADENATFAQTAYKKMKANASCETIFGNDMSQQNLAGSTSSSTNDANANTMTSAEEPAAPGSDTGS